MPTSKGSESDLVLFVERANELWYAARLRSWSSGAEAKASLNRALPLLDNVPRGLQRRIYPVTVLCALSIGTTMLTATCLVTEQISQLQTLRPEPMRFGRRQGRRTKT